MKSLLPSADTVLPSYQHQGHYTVIHEQASATKISEAPWDVNICLHGLKCHAGLQTTAFDMF